MPLRIFTSLLFVSALLIGCKKDELKPPDNLVTGVKRAWALDDGEKIKREDIDNSLASDVNNAVWKDNKINIFGGRNEIISFQLIIQAEEDGVEDVNVVISDLDNGTTIISGSEALCFDPFDFTCRNIELFTEHYLNVTSRTPPLWFFSPSAKPSSYYTGWIPDCLIPFSAPSGKGGAPFSIGGTIIRVYGWIFIYQEMPQQEPMKEKPQ